MNRFPTDDLILHYYGESERTAEIEARLASAPELRERYEELRRVLDAVGEALPVPPRPEGYGAEVWRRLAPRLRSGPAGWRERLGGWLAPYPGGRRRLVPLAAAAVLLLAVGFLAGRGWPPDPSPGGDAAPPPLARTLPPGGRDQILLVAVAGHLERSQRLLTKLTNAEPAGEDAVELAAERRWAADLLAANRLYRQSAQHGGRPRLAGLLDELEPLLLELAHAPDALPAAELATLRERIETRALLFKTRVVTERLERLLRDSEPGATTL